MQEQEYLFQTLKNCIQYSLQGLASDPEYDFATMRENNFSSDLNNATLYNKTGKNLTISRVTRPLKLIIMIDDNQNFQFWNKKSSNNEIFQKIQEEFKNDIQIETLYSQNALDKQNSHEYYSYLEEYIDKAEVEIQQGNVVVVISDLLTSSADTNERLQALSSDHFIALQISIPVFGESYHQYYLQTLAIPQIDHRFKL